MILYDLKIGLNGLQWALIFNKIFTSDAYPVYSMTYVTIFKAT